MSGRDRRPRWRREVFKSRPGMTNSCRVLLLLLLENMNHNGVVSVARSQLAKDLGVAPARVSEAIKLARALGFLDQVRRARPDVTAVYQATIPTPARGTASVPHHNDFRGTETRTCTGTEAVPQHGGSEVRMYPTQVVVQPDDESAPAAVVRPATSAATDPAHRQVAVDDLTAQREQEATA